MFQTQANCRSQLYELTEDTCGFSRRMNRPPRNHSPFDSLPESSHPSIHVAYPSRWIRNRCGPERFPPRLRWRPVRPRQPRNNRNQSMTAVPSQGTRGVDCWKPEKSTPESVDVCRTPRGKNNIGSPNTTEDRSPGGVALPQLHRRQSTTLTRVPTVPEVGGTATLNSPTLRIPPRERGGGCHS